jgi:hypothetical protein
VTLLSLGFYFFSFSRSLVSFFHPGLWWYTTAPRTDICSIGSICETREI